MKTKLATPNPEPKGNRKNAQITLLGSLIKNQQVQNKINQVVYEAIQEQTEQAKKELKAYTDNAINEIKKYIPLNDGEASKLKQAISSRAAVTTKTWIKKNFKDPEYGGNEFFSKKYGHIVRTFYSMTKKHFDAIKYTAILHSDFEEALGYANSLNYFSLPQRTKRITENQLKTLNEWEKRHHKKLTVIKDQVLDRGNYYDDG